LVLELRRAQAFLLRHRGFRVEPIALLVDLPEAGVTHDDRVDDRVFLERELVLAQLADAGVRLDRDVAVGRLELAAQNLEEGGLARAVRADQTVTMAVTELDGDV